MNTYKNLDQTKHGLHKHPLNHIWVNIKQRCNNPKNERYHRYGGRGIKFYDGWNDFLTFYNWAISNGWKEGLHIDRINNDGDYEPSNCRIVTQKINSNNRRDTVYVSVGGIKMPLSLACDKFNLKLEKVRQYMKKQKKTFEDAVKKYHYV